MTGTTERVLARLREVMHEDNYLQPFNGQPLRFLWWLDDKAHRLGIPAAWFRPLCDYVDRQYLK